MCKANPAPRCKKHAQDGLTSAQGKYDKASAEVTTAEAELQAAQAAGRATARIERRVARLQKEQQAALDKLQLAQLAYDSTPDGQKLVEKLLRDKNLTAEERDSLNARLETARAYRVWQARTAKKLAEIEQKDGPEAALKWAERESKAAGRRVKQIEMELAAKWAADQAKRFRNLPPEEQLVAILRTASKIYYRLNRYRMLYRALTGDLDKFVATRLKSAAINKLSSTFDKVAAGSTRQPKAA